MIYKMAPLPARLSVDGIYSVLKVDFSQKNGIGEAHDFPELSYIASGMNCGTQGSYVYSRPVCFTKRKPPPRGRDGLSPFPRIRLCSLRCITA